jgi:hypothetical protein
MAVDLLGGRNTPHRDSPIKEEVVARNNENKADKVRTTKKCKRLVAPASLGQSPLVSIWGLLVQRPMHNVRMYSTDYVILSKCYTIPRCLFFLISPWFSAPACPPPLFILHYTSLYPWQRKR